MGTCGGRRGWSRWHSTGTCRSCRRFPAERSCIAGNMSHKPCGIGLACSIAGT
ncbi:unnamed protein product [Linum tenue]|uniref:Uncharacterized protein n=1 Tax=Linum tenue TaxID=586396 RepID=A0AAV0LNB9_9ROSI|nr:unnamed protein product [Linum tenue]